jgi:peptidoglycan hydrolase-like protein with peptidoglycan-binding domain
MATPTTIQQGSKGPLVTLAQKHLTDRGYNAGAADGLYGVRTRNAVRSDQSDRMKETVQPLSVDGIIGPRTWARLDPPTIKMGAKGDPVKLAQHLVGHFGINVAVDGDFGANTEKAVKQFQGFMGTLTVDGIAGPLTWTALGS